MRTLPPATLALAFLFALAAPVRAGDADTGAAIAARLAEPEPRAAGVPLDGYLLRGLYEPRANAPLWSAHDPRTVVAILRGAGQEGLDPADYDPEVIAGRIDADDPAGRADLDLLLSNAVLHYASDLRYGRLAPTARTAQVAPVPKTIDPVALARGVAESPDAVLALHDLAPAHPQYRSLRDTLARYRPALEGGGWPSVPAGPTLHPGTSDPVVPVLRRRLVVSGDLDDPSTGSVYDDRLEGAVRGFQRRHGIAADGVVNEKTWSALDVSAQARARQIGLNMERWRWLPDDLGTRYALVNIPGFWLRLIDDGKIALEMPVVVGKDDWETPTFSSAINEVIFNPKWSVPVSIARDEVLPAVRRDPGYVARHNMKVYAGWSSGAGQVDPGAVNWRAVGPNSYRFVQVPGPRNPLGQIKFNFPNPFGVYLHDAPSRSLFQRPVRAFSHGCIRVGNAPALAAEVLDDMPEWNPGRRQATLRTGRTRAVALRSPLPLYVTYQTAWVDPDGIAFRADIYGRDADLAKALARVHEKPRITAPPPPPPPPAPMLEEPGDQPDAADPAAAPVSTL